MRVRHAHRHDQEEIELQMTPMIDIVFQLLIFFVMTFKIVVPEGDFNINMPANPVQGPADPTLTPPITVTMLADSQGELAEMHFGTIPLGTDFDALHEKIREQVPDDAGPGSGEPPEITLKCDYDLKYKYTMAAITAVTGYENERKEIVKIVDTIKFAPVQRGGSPGL